MKKNRTFDRVSLVQKYRVLSRSKNAEVVDGCRKKAKVTVWFY